METLLRNTMWRSCMSVGNTQLKADTPHILHQANKPLIGIKNLHHRVFHQHNTFLVKCITKATPFTGVNGVRLELIFVSRHLAVGLLGHWGSQPHPFSSLKNNLRSRWFYFIEDILSLGRVQDTVSGCVIHILCLLLKFICLGKNAIKVIKL